MKLQFKTTRFPNNVKQVETGELTFAVDNKTENNVINLYPEMKGQTFEGFGGAFTDSAGFVYSQMADEAKRIMLNHYFSPDEMNYRFGRIHLDSCDFSLNEYSALETDDPSMTNFSLARTQKYILPLLRDAEKFAGKPLEIMVSPWSPPKFMKTNGERKHGGSLKRGYEQFWADYLCKYIIELRKLGVNVSRLSIQNEPKAVQEWDSCIYIAAQERSFLKKFLYPTLQKNGLSDVEIFIWDHNKERVFERACEIIDSETEHMVAGIAFHWYSGDHFEALALIREKFPDKKLVLSEACIEYSKFDAEDYLVNAQKYGHDIIGNLNAGMTAFYDWNIVLDEEGGPNHAGNLCDAPYLYSIKNHQLLERNTCAYLQHFSQYIEPNSVRIGFSRYTTDLEVTAFQTPKGDITAIIMNPSQKEKASVIRLKGESVKLNIPAMAITSIRIR